MSPQFIMLRTAMGLAWDKDTSRRLSKIKTRPFNADNWSIEDSSIGRKTRESNMEIYKQGCGV
jgi:hypothetical protein